MDIKQEDEKLLKAIRQVIAKGNNAEVRKLPGGKLAVYEVKKHMVTS